ncbi:hypothetical protein RchiOBHm_Chr1g0329231 [Rosa chinensis]|uniref:Reverse transcriptase zinc-binding domain-containing protein n=1 Tax=Rosa chinensis TaxID=74649 RepID=A0A2P6SB06_ROSCH|nr:hypothetical protein RchiOBHm_Chr1g0329231 [Rosa chinensis]
MVWRWKGRNWNKVKLLLWRACHRFLPCGEHLLRCKIGPNRGCERCGGDCVTLFLGVSAGEENLEVYLAWGSGVCVSRGMNQGFKICLLMLLRLGNREK